MQKVDLTAFTMFFSYDTLQDMLQVAEVKHSSKTIFFFFKKTILFVFSFDPYILVQVYETFFLC